MFGPCFVMQYLAFYISIISLKKRYKVASYKRGRTQNWGRIPSRLCVCVCVCVWGGGFMGPPLKNFVLSFSDYVHFHALLVHLGPDFSRLGHDVLLVKYKNNKQRTADKTRDLWLHHNKTRTYC